MMSVVAMKIKLALLFSIAVLPCVGQGWTLERLYTRPYIWGTAPQSLTWAKDAHTLVFR